MLKNILNVKGIRKRRKKNKEQMGQIENKVPANGGQTHH